MKKIETLGKFIEDDTKHQEQIIATTNQAAIALHAVAKALLPISEQFEEANPHTWKNRQASWSNPHKNGKITLSLIGSMGFEDEGVSVQCNIRIGLGNKSAVELEWRQPLVQNYPDGKFAPATPHPHPRRLVGQGEFISWRREKNAVHNVSEITTTEILQGSESIRSCIFVHEHSLHLAKQTVGFIEHAAKSAGGTNTEEGLQNLFNGLIESMAKVKLL